MCSSLFTFTCNLWIYHTFSFVLILMDNWAVSRLWLLWMMLLWSFLLILLYTHECLYTWGLLYHRWCVFSTLLHHDRQFSKDLSQLTFPPAVDDSSNCSSALWKTTQCRQTFPCLPIGWICSRVSFWVLICIPCLVMSLWTSKVIIGHLHFFFCEEPVHIFGAFFYQVDYSLLI